jgi:ATP-binding cassette, subfamily B, bacterial
MGGRGKSRKVLNAIELLRPHSTALVIGLVAAAGEAAANLLEPWPLKIVFDNVLRAKPTHGWLYMVIMRTVGENQFEILGFAVAAVLAIACLGAVSSYTEKYFSTSVGQWVTHDLRQMLCAHVQLLSLPYHDQKQTGDLISRATSDIDAIQSFIVSGLLGVLIDSLTLVGMLGVMFYINWRFTLIALSVVPVLFLVVFSFTRRIKKASREVRKKEGEIVSVIEEALSSIRVVKAFAREDYEVQRLEERSLEGIETAMRARSLKAKLPPFVEIIVAIGTCLVLWFGVRMVLIGTLSAGSLIVFILYLGKMYKPMQDLSKMADAYSKAAVGYERIREVLETDRQVNDLPRARQAPRFKGQIEFEHVSFGYTEDRPILRGVNLKIESGQLAALVGPTGAGKTTIVSLISRFYDPNAGAVKIDAWDVRRFTQKSLRQQMSFVLQETLLFRASVWENIAYGKPTASRREILHAAEIANAHEFIEKLPEGYNTMVGERGITLSGGQRQRIAIARAVIRKTPILILDEPSSSLDAASEKLVFEALDRLTEGKTTIVIAHRLSTVRRADIIFVVKEGEIVERGKHEVLLKRHGLYADLCKLQFQGEADAGIAHPMA